MLFAAADNVWWNLTVKRLDLRQAAWYSGRMRRTVFAMAADTSSPPPQPARRACRGPRHGRTHGRTDSCHLGGGHISLRSQLSDQADIVSSLAPGVSANRSTGFGQRVPAATVVACMKIGFARPFPSNLPHELTVAWRRRAGSRPAIMESRQWSGVRRPGTPARTPRTPSDSRALVDVTSRC